MKRVQALILGHRVDHRIRVPRLQRRSHVLVLHGAGHIRRRADAVLPTPNQKEGQGHLRRGLEEPPKGLRHIIETSLVILVLKIENTINDRFRAFLAHLPEYPVKTRLLTGQLHLGVDRYLGRQRFQLGRHDLTHTLPNRAAQHRLDHEGVGCTPNRLHERFYHAQALLGHLEGPCVV